MSEEGMTSVFDRSFDYDSDDENRILEIDDELRCMICHGLLREPYMTSCGHSFCFRCIRTHKEDSSLCPVCSQHIQSDAVPNFTLHRIVQKLRSQVRGTPLGVETAALVAASAAAAVLRSSDPSLSSESGASKSLSHPHPTGSQPSSSSSLTSTSLPMSSSPSTSSASMSISEIDRIMAQLSAVRRQLEEARKVEDVELARQFLELSKRQKSEAILRLVLELKLISADLDALTRKQNHSLSGSISVTADSTSSLGTGKRVREDEIEASEFVQEKLDRLSSQYVDVMQVYLGLHSSDLAPLFQRAAHGQFPVDHFQDMVSVEISHTPAALDEFVSRVSKYTHFSGVRVHRRFRFGDVYNSSNTVCSIEFDPDAELFAAAGVTKKIKVYSFEKVIRSDLDTPYPQIELSHTSRFSSLSWSPYIKAHLASADYDGLVAMWDLNTRTAIARFSEHSLRVWSVAYAPSEPRWLASASDDGRVKIWSTNQSPSLWTLSLGENMCSVAFSPMNPNLLACSSANQLAYVYDLRNIHVPLFTFQGHGRAVSYVRWLNQQELITASTDSTIRLWNIKEGSSCRRVFQGHTNSSNFVGLASHEDFIVCGSESNSTYLYYKGFSKPVLHHSFEENASASTANSTTSSALSLPILTQTVHSDSSTSSSRATTPNSSASPTSAILSASQRRSSSARFISAVTWKPNSNRTFMAANNEGVVEILELNNNSSSSLPSD